MRKKDIDVIWFAMSLYCAEAANRRFGQNAKTSKIKDVVGFCSKK